MTPWRSPPAIRHSAAHPRSCLTTHPWGMVRPPQEAPEPPPAWPGPSAAGRKRKVWLRQLQGIPGHSLIRRSRSTSLVPVGCPWPASQSSAPPPVPGAPPWPPHRPGNPMSRSATSSASRAWGLGELIGRLTRGKAVAIPGRNGIRVEQTAPAPPPPLALPHAVAGAAAFPSATASARDPPARPSA